MPKSEPFYRYAGADGPPPSPGPRIPVPPEVRRLLGSRAPEVVSLPRQVPAPVFSPEKRTNGPLRWSYGVTTCPDRARNGLLSRTLTSLSAAGFDRPRVFVDGTTPVNARSDDPRLGLLTVVERGDRVKPYLNWVLAFTELYYRDPCADRFAVFQDDVVFVRNLRAYLDACPWPGRAYLNLYSDPSNERLFPPGAAGWREARGVNSGHPHANPAQQGLQAGQGALGLVFDRAAAQALLASPHLTNRLTVEPGPGNRLADRELSPTGWRSLDGAVVTAMNYAGFREYVHAPSLCQHVGDVSTIDKAAGSLGDGPFVPKRYTAAQVSGTFPGETFDAATWLIGPAQV